MRFLVSAFAVLALAGQAVPAVAADASCKTALDSVMSEWQAAAYPMPLKPAQAYVIGRNGYRASGSEVTYMRTQLTLASQECNDGNSSAALDRVASVQRLMTRQAAAAAAPVVTKDGDGRAPQQ